MSDEYAELLKSVSNLAEQLDFLNRRAVREYAPVVAAIMQTQSCDVHHIEQTLDGLLAFCGYEPALRLYKKLCRYYYHFAPSAAADYVQSYQEMWDMELEGE